MVKKLIVFDLDGTLAASKSSLDAEMSNLLHDLLGVVKVAIISGGAWLQFEKQVLSNLPQDDRLSKLSILPTCGTEFFQYTGEWKNSVPQVGRIDSFERRSSWGRLESTCCGTEFFQYTGEWKKLYSEDL